MKNRDILENILNSDHSRKFNFVYFNSSDKIGTIKGVTNCGTSGCLAGELPFYDEDWEFIEGGLMYKGSRYEVYSMLEKYFDIPLRYVLAIFYPNQQKNNINELPNVGLGATRKQVVANAWKVLEIYDRDQEELRLNKDAKKRVF